MLVSRRRSLSEVRPRFATAFPLLLLWSILHHLQLGAAFFAAAPVKTKLKMFKARYPLEGGPPQIKLHVAVIVEEAVSVGKKSEQKRKQQGDPGTRLVLFDFLPDEPTALPTAFRLLTGQNVRGNLRERELRFLPPGSVCVGESDATLDEMRGFVAEYPDRLSLVSNNCLSFVDAFVAKHLVVSQPSRKKSE
ncbi:unnamed protein product [Scytosiphon promiscuus]